MYIHGETVDEYEVGACALGFLLLVIFVGSCGTSHQEGGILGFGFLRIAVDDSHDLLVEDAVVDVGLLRMEVLIERCANHTIAVGGDSETLEEGIDVGVVSALPDCCTCVILPQRATRADYLRSQRTSSALPVRPW